MLKKCVSFRRPDSNGGKRPIRFKVKRNRITKKQSKCQVSRDGRKNKSNIKKANYTGRCDVALRAFLDINKVQYPSD